MWYWVYCFLSDFFVSDGHRYVGIARVWCLYDLFGKLNHTGLRCSDKHCLLCIGIFWSGVCAAAFSLFCASLCNGGWRGVNILTFVMMLQTSSISVRCFFPGRICMHRNRSTCCASLESSLNGTRQMVLTQTTLQSCLFHQELFWWKTSTGCPFTGVSIRSCFLSSCCFVKCDHAWG